MAQASVSFPKIAESNWWKVRDLFKRKVPTAVTPNYLASSLSMSEGSARSNILSPFKRIGLLGDDGRPTDLAYNWRDDEKYPAVCQSIIESVYPVELRDFYHDLDQDPSGLTGWFMNYCRCGEPAARMYTAFYRLLLRADPTNQEQPSMKPPTPANKLSTPRLAQSRKKTEVPESQVRPALGEPLEVPRQIQSTSEALFSPVPQFHINIQLHISPETSAEQIDKIFESMSRHLRNLVELRQ